MTSQPELVEFGDRIEIRSPMRPETRVLIATAGLVPLLAPYELLIRVQWEHYLNPFFAFAALIWRAWGQVSPCSIAGFGCPFRRADRRGFPS